MCTLFNGSSPPRELVRNNVTAHTPDPWSVVNGSERFWPITTAHTERARTAGDKSQIRVVCNFLTVNLELPSTRCWY